MTERKDNPRRPKGGQFLPEERQLLIEMYDAEVDEGPEVGMDAMGFANAAQNLDQMLLIEYDETSGFAWLKPDGRVKAKRFWEQKYFPGRAGQRGLPPGLRKTPRANPAPDARKLKSKLLR